MQTAKQVFTVTAAAVVVTATMFLGMDFAFSMPEVYKSHSTGECVKVVSYPGLVFGKDEGYSCENLPLTYDTVWTE